MSVKGSRCAHSAASHIPKDNESCLCVLREARAECDLQLMMSDGGVSRARIAQELANAARLGTDQWNSGGPRTDGEKCSEKGNPRLHSKKPKYRQRCKVVVQTHKGADGGTWRGG